MELWFKDDVSEEMCRDKHPDVVELTHDYLGLASVVEVESVPNRNVLKLSTAWGTIFIDTALTRVID